MWLLSVIVFVSGLDCEQKQNFNIWNSSFPFKLQNLPYDIDFLSEVFSPYVVSLHHNVIQSSYVASLNAYLSQTPVFNNTYLAALCTTGWANGNLNKYAGGVYNHYVY